MNDHGIASGDSRKSFDIDEKRINDDTTSIAVCNVLRDANAATFEFSSKC